MSFFRFSFTIFLIIFITYFNNAQRIPPGGGGIGLGPPSPPRPLPSGNQNIQTGQNAGIFTGTGTNPFYGGKNFYLTTR